MWRNVFPVLAMLFVLFVTFGGLTYIDPPKHVVAHVLKKTDRLPIEPK